MLRLHAVAHFLRRGHTPEFARLDTKLICRKCDLGAPPPWAVWSPVPQGF